MGTYLPGRVLVTATFAPGSHINAVRVFAQVARDADDQELERVAAGILEWTSPNCTGIASPS